MSHGGRHADGKSSPSTSTVSRRSAPPPGAALYRDGELGTASSCRTSRQSVSGIRCLSPNTVPTGPTAARRPEADYCLRRLVDERRRITGIDRGSAAAAHGARAQCHTSAVGTTYDSGDFAAVFDEALASADVAGFAARWATSQAAGKRRGLGVSCSSRSAGASRARALPSPFRGSEQASAGDRRAGERAGAPNGLSPPCGRLPRHPGRDH